MGHRGSLGKCWPCNANAVRCWHTSPHDASGDGCAMRCLCARRAAACAAPPPRAQAREASASARWDHATCRNDTKLPHKWAQVIVACASVSISHIGSDTPLVLCQHWSSGTLLACSSRRRWSSPRYLSRSMYQSLSLVYMCTSRAGSGSPLFTR